MEKNESHDSTEAAAPSTLSATDPAGVASQSKQPAGPLVSLKRHVGKDGVKLDQDEIYLDVDGKNMRVGYAGHGPKGGIALIRRVTDEEKLAIESEVAAKLGSWPTKTAFAPAIGDLVDDVAEEEDDEEDELDDD
jgi:hypothetical protein